MKHVVEKEKLVLAVEQVHILMNECLIAEMNIIPQKYLPGTILVISICIILGNIESPW